MESTTRAHMQDGASATSVCQETEADLQRQSVGRERKK